MAKGAQLTLYPGDDSGFLPWVSSNSDAVANGMRTAYSDARAQVQAEPPGEPEHSKHSIAPGKTAEAAPALGWIGDVPAPVNASKPHQVSGTSGDRSDPRNEKP